MYWNIKFISEHGAFPFVIVWVWHGEPGNLHPCNSNAWITYSPHYHHELQFEPELLPTPHLGDKNEGISGMQNLKGNVTKMQQLVTFEGNLPKM